MKRHKSFGSGVLIVVALLLAAIPASASAKSSLEFTEAGNTRQAPTGASAILVLNLGAGKAGGCSAYELGELGTDPEKKIVVKGSGVNLLENCEEGTSQSGHIEEETWSDGKLKVKGKVEITHPGPCVYEYTKFKLPAPFAVPGEAAVQGVAKGKLVKEASSKVKGVCEKKLETEFQLGAADEEFEAFGTRLT